MTEMGKWRTGRLVEEGEFDLPEKTRSELEKLLGGTELVSGCRKRVRLRLALSMASICSTLRFRRWRQKVAQKLLPGRR